jgi:U3 small nucleolar RNA-associated protein 11
LYVVPWAQKVERLKGELHFLVDQPRNTHTVFVDEEAEATAFNPAQHFDTAPELAARAYNRPRKETLETQGA